MAGVKGRSGGARPGAGRPRQTTAALADKAAQEAAKRIDKAADAMRDKTADVQDLIDSIPGLLPKGPEDPREFLQFVMNNQLVAPALRVKAAQSLIDGSGPKGKKEELHDAAKQVGASKFGASPQPPKLKAVN